VKSKGIQFNKTKGLPTITEWNVVPHMENAKEVLHLKCTDTQKKKGGGKKN
jgi:hypothetical protein